MHADSVATTQSNTHTHPSPHPSFPYVEDKEDTMSVCSSNSSGTDRSGGRVKRKVKRNKCPIHNKKEKTPTNNETKPINDLPAEQCTCNKSKSTKQKTIDPLLSGLCGLEQMSASVRSTRRPEPEGGCKTPMTSSIILLSASEADQVLLNNDPLFSEGEDDYGEEKKDGYEEEVVKNDGKLRENVKYGLDADDDFFDVVDNNNAPKYNKYYKPKQQQQQQQKQQISVDEQIKKESDRFHKRFMTRTTTNNNNNNNNTDNKNNNNKNNNLETIFSCLQSLNTNSSIKFAILQTELKNIKDCSLKRMDVDTTALLHRYEKTSKLMEEHKENMSVASSALKMASKMVDECLRKEKENDQRLKKASDLLTHDSLKQLYTAADVDAAEELMSQFERQFRTTILNINNSKNSDVKKYENELSEISRKMRQLDDTINRINFRLRS